MYKWLPRAPQKGTIFKLPEYLIFWFESKAYILSYQETIIILMKS